MVAIAGTAWWHPVAFGALIIVLMVLGLQEFFTMTAGETVQPFKTLVILIAVVSFLSAMMAALGFLPPWSLAIAMPLLTFPLLAELFRKKKDPLLNAVFVIFPLIYIALPLTLLNLFHNPLLREGISMKWVVLGYFILVWVNDTFAYIVGSLIGRHKLFPSVSPAKSWEGAAGGLIFSVIAAWPVSLLFHDLSLTDWVVIAVITVILGILGDLSESMIKRRYRLKDTGTLMPGHGGVLDRFDALFFSAPAVYLYLVIIFS